MQTCSVFKPTSDDWYDNFSGDELEGNVEVTFISQPYPDGGPYEDICTVAGNDDCELSYEGADAEYKFMLIIAMKDVTMQAVLDLGFTQGY